LNYTLKPIICTATYHVAIFFQYTIKKSPRPLLFMCTTGMLVDISRIFCKSLTAMVFAVSAFKEEYLTSALLFIEKVFLRVWWVWLVWCHKLCRILYW